MKRFTICGFFFGLTLTVALMADRAWAQEKFELPPISDNAALQYWQAFGTLPAFDADQEKKLENWVTTPLGVGTAKMLDGSQTSLMFLRRGSRMRECDWGLDYNEGISMHLPHLAKARTLARVAALDFRRNLAAGNMEAGGENLHGLMVLARHVGQDYTLVSALVCYAIENMVVDIVAPQALELKIPYADSVAAYESLPPAPSLVHSVMCEKFMASSIIAQLKEAEQKRAGSWREVWSAIVPHDMPEKLKDLQSLDELVEVAEDFQGTYDELAKLLELPPKEFDAKYPEFAKRAGEANPITAILLPAMEKVVATQRRTQARLEMLLAAAAVVESGPEKLAEIADPFGDGPFGYRKLDEGFELSSKLVYEGKPVTLVIGPSASADSP